MNDSNPNRATTQLDDDHQVADAYAYRVNYSTEDGEYVATALEWGPGLSWLDPNPIEALSGLREQIAQSIRDLRADGKPVPEPLAAQNYSGKLLARLPVSLHASLARHALEEGISLNQLLVNRLTAAEVLAECTRVVGAGSVVPRPWSDLADQSKGALSGTVLGSMPTLGSMPNLVGRAF